MVPSCDQLPNAFRLDRDFSRRAFEDRLREVGVAADGWVVDAECRDCGQRWRVDRPDKYQVDLAIKVPGSAEWTDADDRRARLAYLRRSFGGDGESACMWAGCPHHALRGTAVCAEHAYASGTRAKGA